MGHSLERLEWDLRIYFAGLDASADEIAARWLELEFFRMFVPLGIPSYLRSLFLSNTAVVLKLIASRRDTRQTAASGFSPLPAKYLPTTIELRLLPGLTAK